MKDEHVKDEHMKDGHVKDEHMKDGHVKDGHGNGRATGRGAGLSLRGPGGARPPRHATTTAVFVQLALKCGRNWAAQWHLARAVGKRFRGCRVPRKATICRWAV